MRKRSAHRASFAIVTVLLILAFVAPASAHEQRTIGPYQIAFGWRNEPTYVGQFKWAGNLPSSRKRHA
jgi:hypothetical protein